MKPLNQRRAKDIIRSYETIGTPTLKSLHEFALLQDYTGGQTPDQIVKMLQDIGQQFRKERYERDLLLSVVRRLQCDNDRLRQLEMFKSAATTL